MNQIHLIMPFMREENKEILLNAYRPMNIILHPILFWNENISFDEPWIFPVVIPSEEETGPKGMEIQNIKRNWFIENCEIIDEDYYVAVDDDDMYEEGVFDKIKKMQEDIVIISMKRGQCTPLDVIPDREYPTNTLVAHPSNAVVGSISNQQSFVKGSIFKKYLYDADGHCGDGRLAVRRKEAGEQIRYEPNLYALFNYYEPGRWLKSTGKFAFGCMYNNAKRLELILKNSNIGDVPCFTIYDPETATKGLNKLLDIIEKSGAEIGILTHNDMFYREHWLPQVQDQLKKLPEDWVIAGIVGKDETGELCGTFHDMSTPLWIVSKHEYPVRCSCIDECTIIVNMKTGFRFEEELIGFDLYGTYACLRANEMGSAWLIEAWAEHYCSRFWGQWEPDQVFMDMWKWLYNRFPGKRLESTVLLGEDK